MPRLEYFLVSESTSTDAESRRVSVYNIINEVRFTGEGTPIPQLACVSCWIFSDEEIQNSHESHVRIRLTVPGDAHDQGVSIFGRT